MEWYFLVKHCDIKLYEDRLKGFAFYMRADWRTEQNSVSVRMDLEAA
jgi:hypothetical protein